ncbi:hypothetical protein ACLOJK_025996, partial [Asimina triloba]
FSLPADAEDQLFQGINDYRASLKVPALTQNKNAECLAEQIADQFEDQTCTNSTGANTVPGTETQFPNYPKYLQKCHLNATNTRDGIVMPACVPNLDSKLVLTNFTKSQYSQYLNDSQYTGAGIAAENNWIVVVLSTSTPTGNYAPATATNSAAALVPKLVGLHSHLVLLSLGLLMMVML